MKDVMRHLAVAIPVGVACFAAGVFYGHTIQPPGAGTAPKVVATIPANAAIEVDPSLREILVIFDRDMSKEGVSFCGGPALPSFRSDPEWIDERVVTTPVRLRPDAKYELSINCEDGSNFKSADGVPAEPYPLSFVTSATPSAHYADEVREENRKSIEELREAIQKNYSHRDLRVKDWDAVFEKHVPKLERADSVTEFAREAARLLANAKDFHVSLRVGDESIPTYVPVFESNVNLQTLGKVVPAFVQRSSAVHTGVFDREIGYIMIGSWASGQIDSHEPAFEALEVFSDAPGLILDVRTNGGGDERLAQYFAGCFVDWPAEYGRSKYRDPENPDEFTKPAPRQLIPKRGRPQYRGKIAVLMGQGCMSSCEGFLLMMKKVENCQLFGDRSYGGSGMPRPVTLTNGIGVILPSWVSMLPDGTPFEGKGITPDVVIETTPEDFKDQDPLIDAALAWIRG